MYLAHCRRTASRTVPRARASKSVPARKRHYPIVVWRQRVSSPLPEDLTNRQLPCLSHVDFRFGHAIATPPLALNCYLRLGHVFDHAIGLHASYYTFAPPRPHLWVTPSACTSHTALALTTPLYRAMSQLAILRSNILSHIFATGLFLGSSNNFCGLRRCAIV